MRRRRPALAPGHERRTAVGVVFLVGLVALCAFVFSGGVQRTTATRGSEVRAIVPTTARLADGTDVRVHGVRVGRVKETELLPGGRSSSVTMVVTDDALPVYRDARARVAWRSLLGGNYALELDPGTPSSGELGDQPIPLTHSESQVEVDEILAGIQRRERSGLRTTLSEVPRAFTDPQALASTLDAVADGAPDLAAGIGAVRGSRRGDLRRLVANTSLATAALDVPGDLTSLVEGGAVATGVTARRSAEIEQSFARAAGLLPRVRRTARMLDVALEAADPLLADLRTAAPSLAPALATLRPALTEADELLADAVPLVRNLRPAARSLAAAARDARPLVDQLLPIVRRIGAPILADLAKPDPVTKKPTYQMIGSAVSALDAAAGAFDQVSHYVSLTAGGGERIVDSLPCRTYFGTPDPAELATCEDLNEYLQKLLPLGPGKAKGRR